VNILVKILSTSVSAGARIAKFLGLGNADVQTAAVAAPYGIDSNPVKDMVAIYSSTIQQGEPVIIGYINRNAIAEVGGLRMYSTNANGAEQVYIYLRASGKIELAGNTDNVVRYLALNNGIQQMGADINTNLAAIATAINAIVPGSYTPVPVVPNISAAKVNEVQTTS